MLFERIGQGITKDDIPKELQIELNKQLARTMSTVRSKCKSGTCFYCNNPVQSFCNSHNIPRFCLENIGIDGNVTGPNAIFELPTMGVPMGKETIGINSSGTFQIICRECDSIIFQDYENPDNYLKSTIPSQKMLAEIAMKNYLKFISKRKLEIALYNEQKKLCEEKGIISNYYRQKTTVGISVSELDLRTYTNDFNKAKRIAERGETGYYIIYYKLLPYVAPIAVQSPIVLSIDLEGNIVNDIFNMNAQYIPTDLHLCVFPLKNHTAVLLFINDGDNRYRKFYKQFRKQNEIEQLGIINYLIFLYSEDYFLAKDIGQKVDLQQFKDVATKTPIIWNDRPVCDTNVLADEFSLKNWNSIPNLLSEKYKIR